MKVYHVADVHLGRRRLDGRLPDQDFAAAFAFVAEAAIADQADVLLIAGDLFDRPQVEPPHLRQAQAVLRRLRAAGLTVIAVEGNHDKAFVHSTEATWVQYLAQDDLLVVLRPRFTADGAVLEPWDPDARRGAVLDCGGIRFVGAGYLGAATPAKVRQILARLEPGRPHVLLLHAGPDYFVGEGGGFGKEDLRALEQAVCYLALGHIHKPTMYSDWACNPGSLEHCELREAASDRPEATTPRGYAVLELDPALSKPSRMEIRANPRRPVHRIELDCTPFGTKTRHGAESLVAAAVAAIAERRPTPEAAIDLWLTGRLNLNRIALDQAAASAEIAAAAAVLAVAIDTTRLNLDGGFAAAGAAGEADLPRDELERRAIRRLVEAQPLWGLDAEHEQVAALFYELKEAVRANVGAEEMAARIATSPLLGAIQAAKAAATGGQPGAEARP